MSEHKLQTEIILESLDGDLHRLEPTDLSVVPNKGDMYLHPDNKTVYGIKEVIHSDLMIILIVQESEIDSSKIWSLIY